MYYASYVTSDGFEAGAGWFSTAAEASAFLSHVAVAGKEIRDPQVLSAPQIDLPDQQPDRGDTLAIERAP